MRDLYYITSPKTCYTARMSNQPAYRNRTQPSGGCGILIPFFAAMIFVIWPYAVWHGCRYGGGSGLSGCGAESDWVWNGQTWTACGIWWGLLASPLVIAGIAGTGKRRPVPPKGRLRVEALTPERLPPPPASISVPRPPCYHLDAVPVDLSTGERVAWWCEACEAQLAGDFGRLARPCCGSAAGTRHAYNCPHLKGVPR